MEGSHRELLVVHRASFAQEIDAPERLLPELQSAQVITAVDYVEITAQPSPSQQVEKLLDILPWRGPRAFHALCSALENTYPSLLTVMFFGGRKGKIS